MRRWSSEDLRAIALDRILAPLWRRRDDFALGTGLPLSGLLPIQSTRIITDLVGLRLEEWDEIIPDRGPDPRAGYQFAGMLDREL